MNSVYIDSAVAASPIYIGPTNTNSVIIGNANATTTLVGTLNIGTVTPNTVSIGKENSTTNLYGSTNLGLVTSGTKPSYIEVGSGGGNAVIDFRSSGLFDVDFDSRIISTGGTSAFGEGKLNYYAASHVFNGNVSMNAGSNITLQPATGYVAPTADTMLGGITNGTMTLPTFPITSSTNLATMTLGKGTYLVFFGFQIDGNPSQCWIETIGTALPALNSIPSSYRFGNSVLITGNNLQISGSFPYSITTAGTIVLILQLVGTVTNIPVYKFQAVRIA